MVVLGDLLADKTASVAESGIVAEKLRAILANPYLLKSEQTGGTDASFEHRCTSSIGVVLFLGHEAGTEEIISRADMAMYQAKERGGNSIRYFEA